MKKTEKLFGLTAIMAVIGFFALPLTGCSDSGDGDGGGGGVNGKWRVSGYKDYTVTDGVANNTPNYSYSYNYISYTDDKHCEYEYSYNISSSTPDIYYHVTRNGQNYIQITDTESFTSSGSSYTYSDTTTTYQSVYDLETGLIKNTSSTSATENITPSSTTSSSSSSGQSYLIDLIGEAEGVRTYKYYVTVSTNNGVSQNVSNTGYTEYKIKNGRILESKSFAGESLLQSITTYTRTNNQEIISKIGDYYVSSTTYPSNPENHSNSTVEVVSSGPYNFTIRTKTFVNRELSSQYDTIYEYKTGASAPPPYTGNHLLFGEYEVIYSAINGVKGVDIVKYNGDVGRKTKGSVTIPSQLGGNRVTRIDEYVFRNCYKLTGVTIPSSVNGISEGAFYNCIRLASVIIPDSVIDIDSSAFSNTAWLNNQTDGVVYAGKVAYTYKGTVPTSIILAEGTKAIAGYAFFNRSNLTSVTIPSGVTFIGHLAFSDCTSLASITIPDSVIDIDSSAFKNTAWFNSQPDGVVYAGKVAYVYKGTMPANTSITLTAGTKSIAESFISSNSNLTSVTIPDSVTYIGALAFHNCTNLTSVTFNGTIKKDSFQEIAFYILNVPYSQNMYGAFYATNPENGTPGTYIRSGNGTSQNPYRWTKQ